MLRLAAATRSFNLPLRQSIRAAADAGAEAIQLDLREELKPGDLTETGRRQWMHHLAEIGLKIGSAAFPTRHALYDEQHVDARMAALRQAMSFAWDLQAAVLTTRIGPIPAADSREYRLLVELLNDLARHGNHVGVTLAVTPVRESPESLLQLLPAVTAGPIGIDFDPVAFVLAGAPAGETVRALHAWIRHVQARDAVRDIAGGGTEVPLGRGEVDWVELLASLQEIEYRDWITVVRSQGTDRAADVSRAVKYLRTVMFE
jgi:sugar phosphate isomerase/epimerase